MCYVVKDNLKFLGPLLLPSKSWVSGVHRHTWFHGELGTDLGPWIMMNEGWTHEDKRTTTQESSREESSKYHFWLGAHETDRMAKEEPGDL